LATLLHLSLFIFFVGLVIYLSSTNHLVFVTVLWWVVLSMTAYLFITLMPTFLPNCPYYAPLSSPIRYLYGSIRYALFKILSSLIGCFHLKFADRFRRSKGYYNQFFENIGKTAEEIALRQASEIDVRVLQSTFDALDETGAQEEFFGAVPGFFESELVNGVKEHLTDDFRDKFMAALNRFLERTLSFSSVSEPVKSRRLNICLDAARAALGFDGVSQIFRDILNGRWPELIQSVEMVQTLRNWGNKNDEQFTPYLQRIVAQAVVDVRERDYRWMSLVKAEFAVPDPVLRSYVPHGDSVLLAILIHVTRQAFHTGSWTPWVLSSLSGFNIRDTLPKLQHAFCALWNDIILQARDQEEDNTYVRILREIRHTYIDLHRGTDAAPTFPAATHYFDPVLVQPSSYRYCSIASHRQDLTSLTVRTPVPASRLQVSNPSDALPHSLPSRRHRTPGNGAVTLGPSADPSHPTQGFTWPSPATDHVHYSTHAPSTSSSSISESIGTNIAWTWDPDCLVPGEASHDPHQSAPLAAEIATENLVRSDDPAPQIHISESVGTSQDPVAPSLIFQPVPAIFAPSTGPDPGDDPDALEDTTSPGTLSHPLESNKQRDTVAPYAAPDNNEIPSTLNPISQSIPTITVSDSPLPPILLPPLSSGVTTAEHPSFVESALIQPDCIPHVLRSQSSSLTIAGSQISPQVPSAFDVQVTSGMGSPGPLDNARDLNRPIPMTVLLHPDQIAPPAHDVVAATLQPEDQVQHEVEKF
jgi:hypothetical protein